MGPTVPQQLILTEFWIRWRKGELKIDLLREYARYRFPGHHSRAEFAESGIKHRRRCAVCRDEAHHRHHIVQLQRGGPNVPSNIISLCRYCHRLVHMKAGGYRNHLKVGVLGKARKLGPPRLIKASDPRTGENAEGNSAPVASGSELHPVVK